MLGRSKNRETHEDVCDCGGNETRHPRNPIPDHAMRFRKLLQELLATSGTDEVFEDRDVHHSSRHSI